MIPATRPQVYAPIAAAIDPAGTTLAAYYGNANDLRFTYQTDGFIDDMVDESMAAVALRQTPSGEIEAAYLDALGVVTHARWNGASWASDLIDASTPPNVGCLSVVLGTDGRPRVLYTYAPNRALMLNAWDGSIWRGMTLRVATGSGETAMGSCALALDSDDVPHVVYFIRGANGTDKTLNYTIQNGTGNNWVTATLPVSDLHDDVDLVLDAGGKPHIAAAKANFGPPSYFFLK